jgi:hypothetical protein
MKSLLCFFIVFTTLSAHAYWDLNDVSYLMPIPNVVGSDGLLGIAAPGKGGALITDKVANSLPILAFGMDQEQTNEALRVIGVRVDPCFPLPTPQSCQRQIRLVWQPLETTRRKEVRTVDAALHTFYVLDDSEFAFLLTDLDAWKKQFNVKTQGLPLQVHPAWAQQGDQSPSLAAFNEIVKKYAGAQNMTRLTLMVLRGAGDMWMFAGFDMQGGELVAATVPRLNRRSQTFINQAIPRDHFTGTGIAPAPQGEDTINNLAFKSELLMTVETEETIRKEARAIFRIENPKVFSPENMDCVSCHVAQPAKHWILNNRPEINIEQIWSADMYRNARYDLTNVTPTIWDTRRIRAFGYFGDGPAISQRVINESADVADIINQFIR